MNFLVDTHAVIWFITDNLKLPVKAKKIIEDKKNTCYVSIASYWEIGIKHSLGRLDLSADLGEIFQIVAIYVHQFVNVRTTCADRIL